MENKEKKLEKNEIETIMEMSEEELNEAVGGRDGSNPFGWSD